MTEAPKAAGTDCGKLTALVAWQQRAVARGFLPAELKSETWRGNVEIQLSGPNVALPVWPDVGGSLAGAFAAKGFTLKSVGPCPEACAEGVDCIDGVSVSGVGPRLLLVVAAVDWSDGKVKVVGRAFMPDGAGGIRAVPMRKIEVVGVAALKPAVDAVVADLLK